MLRIGFHSFLVALLVVFPVLGTAVLSRFSPYVPGNTFGPFLGVFLAVTLASYLLVWALPFKGGQKNAGIPAWCFYAAGAVVAFALGLGKPDFSVEMLKHPEREHWRYALLFLGAVLTLQGSFFALQRIRNEVPTASMWIWVLFIPASVEFFWEFFHNYRYAYNLQLWIDSGNQAGGFEASYNDYPVILAGCIGRFCQYGFIAWLAWMQVKAGRFARWAFFILLLFCTTGIFTAVAIAIYQFNLPPSLGILMLFFIPAGPMLPFHWLGLGMLSRREKTL